jgi:hypothetical protein
LQFGLVGHVHGTDNLAADCLECQLDHGKAAILAGFPLPFVPSPLRPAAKLLPAPFQIAGARPCARGPPPLS